MTEVKRDEYTWDQLVRDLAIGSNLSFHEAFAITYPMRTRTDAHPYDLFQPLQYLSTNLSVPIGRDRADELGRVLAGLLGLEKKSLELSVQALEEARDAGSTVEAPGV